MKLPGSSNIPRSATQSWSILGSLLTDNCNAESVVYAQQYGQYVRADAMTSMISNYNVLHELWDWSLANCTVTENELHSHRNEGSNSWSTSTNAAIRVLVWLGVGLQSAHAYCQLECVCVCKESRFMQLKVYHWLS